MESIPCTGYQHSGSSTPVATGLPVGLHLSWRSSSVFDRSRDFHAVLDAALACLPRPAATIPALCLTIQSSASFFAASLLRHSPHPSSFMEPSSANQNPLSSAVSVTPLGSSRTHVPSSSNHSPVRGAASPLSPETSIALAVGSAGL